MKLILKIVALLIIVIVIIITIIAELQIISFANSTKPKKSDSPLQNLQNTKKIMMDRSLKTAIIISNKFHLKRASIIAKRVGINASFSGIFVKQYMYDEIYGYMREAPALLYMYLKNKINF